MKRTTLALPLVIALAGGAVGWLTRPDGDVARPEVPEAELPAAIAPAPATAAPASLPITEDGLISADAVAPDLTGQGTIGAGESLRLPTALDEGDGSAAAPAVVGSETGEPTPEPSAAATETPPAFPAPEGVPSDESPADTAIDGATTGTETTVSGNSAPTDGSSRSDGDGIGTTGAPTYLDPCVRAPAGCQTGVPAVVLDPLEGRLDERILPVEVSQPFAAVGPFARRCALAEGTDVPEPELFASQRPTVAVIVNQPMDLRLTGTWADGTPLAATTMTISAADAAAWQSALDGGQGQGTLLACATLPRAEVEAHAEGRIAPLQATAEVLAGEASYSVGARVELNVPANADRVALATPRITSLGELTFSGRRYPAVDVHLEYLLSVPGQADPANPTGAPPVGTSVSFGAGFATRGRCAAWAEGTLSPDDVFTVDRQVEPAGRWETRVEERSVAGRPQQVQIADLQILGDYDMPAGWEGDVCVGLWAGDRTPIGLWRATARAPRTPQFQVSVGMGELNPDWRVEVELPCRTRLSNGFLDDGTATGVWGRAGADCGVLNGRWFSGGIPVRAYVVDRFDVVRPVLQTTIPVNLEYCNTDDPWSAIVGGCDQSARVYTFEMNLGSGWPQPDTVQLFVRVERRAAPGINMHIDPDPSHQWRIGSVERIG